MTVKPIVKLMDRFAALLATVHTRDGDSYPVLHPPRHHRPEADIGQPQEHEDKDANEGVEHLQHDITHDT